MKERLQEEADGTQVYLSALAFANGSEAWSVRAFNASRKQYQMRDAYYDIGVPRWIRHVPIPLVSGKGIPTIMYLDLLAMRKLGITSGSIKQAMIFQVHHLESVLQMLEQQRKHWRGSIENQFRVTRLYQMRAITLLQSGHRIKNIRLIGGQQLPIEAVIAEAPGHLGKGVIDELLHQYKVTLRTRVPWRFNVKLQLEAL